MSRSSNLSYIEISISEPSLFGEYDNLPPMISTITFIAVIFSVYLLEYFFDIVEEVTDGTMTGEMLVRMQKELMIVGALSFIFKCILTGTHLHANPYMQGFEFAGIISLNF